MLDVYNRDGTPVTADQLCAQLEIICSASQQADEEPVGILTTQHRDSWGKVYTKLISGEPARCFTATCSVNTRKHITNTILSSLEQLICELGHFCGGRSHLCLLDKIPNRRVSDTSKFLDSKGI